MSEQVQKPEGEYDQILSDCLAAPKFGVGDRTPTGILQSTKWFCKFPRALRSFMDEPLYPCQISVSTRRVRQQRGGHARRPPHGVTFATPRCRRLPGTGPVRPVRVGMLLGPEPVAETRR